MRNNPFAPPLAVATGRIDDGARKPKSAWMLQIFAAILLIAFAVGTVRSLSSVSVNHPLSWTRILFLVLIEAILLVIPAGAILGTQRREAYGRWLGLLCIGVIVVFSVVSAFAGHRGGTPVATSDAYEAGRIVGGLVWAVAFAWWFRVFGFSGQARAWFRVSPDHAQP